jgi:hypothetical protein
MTFKEWLDKHTHLGLSEDEIEIIQKVWKVSYNQGHSDGYTDGCEARQAEIDTLQDNLDHLYEDLAGEDI